MQRDAAGKPNCSGDLCLCQRPVDGRNPNGETHTVVLCQLCGLEQPNHPKAVEARKFLEEQKRNPPQPVVSAPLDYAFTWLQRIQKLEKELVAERARADQQAEAIGQLLARVTALEEAETAPVGEAARRKRG